jgi:hypothetical protein
MRPKKRIYLIKKLLKSKKNKIKLLSYWLEGNPLEIKIIANRWTVKEKEIYSYWLENQDLRLTQVLLYSGVIKNTYGMLIHEEEVQGIIDSGIAHPRDILLWGNNYDKSGNKLKTTNWILLRDLETSYITNILKLKNINPIYLEFLNEEYYNRMTTPHRVTDEKFFQKSLHSK